MGKKVLQNTLTVHSEIYSVVQMGQLAGKKKNTVSNITLCVEDDAEVCLYFEITCL